MIFTINPNEMFPIMRGIGDHTDTATYYVRAFVRDAVTDAILATVDLEDKGGQRFQTAWKVVYDNVFQKGRYITIVTSVYTDSGYTTKSENYGDEFETYLVQERWDMAKAASIGGGGGIDYRELRKILKEQLKEIEYPEQKELNIESLIRDITVSVIDNIPEYPEQKPFPDFPEIEKVDLSGVEKEIKSLNTELRKRPQFKETDLTELVNLLDELKKRPEFKETNLSDLLDEILKLKSLILKDVEVFKVIDTANTEKKKERSDLIKKLKLKHGL